MTMRHDVGLDAAADLGVQTLKSPPALPGGTLIANLLRQTPKLRSPPCL